MNYVYVTAINNYNHTPWKRGMRIILTDKDGKNYIATVQRVLGNSLSLLFDNNKKATVDADSPHILGQGVKRKYKGPIPKTKLKQFLTDYQTTRVNNNPELEQYGSNPLNYAKALWQYYNPRFFGSKLKKPAFKWTANNKLLGFFSYTLNNASKEKYSVSNPVVNISRNLVNSEQVFRNTILHQMCHQAVSEIDKQTEHYGTAWQKWARRCGVSGNPATDIPVMVSDKTGHRDSSKAKDAPTTKALPDVPFMTNQIKQGLFCKSKDKDGNWIYGVVLKVSGNKVFLFTKNTIVKNLVPTVSRNSLYRVRKSEAKNIGFTKSEMLRYVKSKKRI